MKPSSTASGNTMGEDRSRRHAGAISLRPVRAEDEGFLFEVYASTRLDELAPLGWTAAQQEAILRLLAAYRQAGIGTAILQDLLAEAARAGMPFRLHVTKLNPARRLYERLGFTTLVDNGVYLFMEWSPDTRERTRPNGDPSKSPRLP
jgi:GNAT superfamily N-acetyltransferase